MAGDGWVWQEMGDGWVWQEVGDGWVWQEMGDGWVMDGCGRRWVMDGCDRGRLAVVQHVGIGAFTLKAPQAARAVCVLTQLTLMGCTLSMC